MKNNLKEVFVIKCELFSIKCCINIKYNKLNFIYGINKFVTV